MIESLGLSSLRGKPWATNWHNEKETLLNFVIEHCPAIIQIMFMERVMKSVKASLIDKEKKTSKVLFSKKEGGLRTRRRHRFTYLVRTLWLGVLYM